MRFAAMTAMGLLFLAGAVIGQNQDHTKHGSKSGETDYRAGIGKVSWPLRADADGTSTAPAYSFASEPDMGIYRKGAGQMGLAKDLIFNRLVSSSDNTPQRGGSILLGQTDPIKAYWAGSHSMCGGTPCIHLIGGLADGTVKVGDVGGAVFPGPIHLAGDPSSDLQAATKQYVDHAVSTASGFVAPPAGPTSVCTVGSWSADANYHYDCYAANSWSRVAKDATWSER